MQNIKLIASDLDGTLLLNGAQSVDESMFEVIDKLYEKGILFAAASGRQVTSLKRLFEPVKDKLMYIGENGALVEYQGKTLVKTPIERELALEIIEDVIKIPSCEVLIGCESTAYFRPKTKEYYHRMTEVVNYHTTLVENFSDIKEDILKIAVCDLSGIANSSEYLSKKWKGKLEATVSGTLYLDYMASGVNKGDAMKKVQKALGINRSECMAFGDNFNDVQMLDAVEYAFVMENAVPEVKLHGQYEVSSVEAALRRRIL